VSLSVSANPFLPQQDESYARWKQQKLANYPASIADLIVPVQDPRALSTTEHASLRARVRKAGMAIYSSQLGNTEDKSIPRLLGRQFGLERLDSNLLADEDAISSIATDSGKSGRGYIPYTSARLLWHTDGYYNPPAQTVRAFILHCVRPAESGGVNALLDPEIAYLLLRDENPEHVVALMAPDAMTIPANDETGARPAQTGPVFSVDPATGSLHMRYTARTRSIVWKDDAPTRAAVKALEQILESDSRWVFRARLESGQGLLCNNVLHNRTAFTDAVDKGAKRLLYRARYYDRISET
jgi:alpha-ketoglutarate-dependent taurine dioxygenase